MFGFEKEKIQLKSVEDYLRTQELLDSGSENVTAYGKARAIFARVKPVILPVVIVLAILAAMTAAFSEMMALRAEVVRLNTAQKEGDLKALKKQIADLTAKIDRSDKQIDELKDDTYGLKAEIETQKAQLSRAAASAAARKAAAAAAEKKKKQVIGRARP
jgi:predicted RNase H-like nuclease (RuvC/YqgF family)